VNSAIGHGEMSRNSPAMLSLPSRADPSKPKPVNDDEPWQPNPSFQHAFVRFNVQRECVISGPPDEVNQIRKNLVEFLTEGKVYPIANGVWGFEIRKQQLCSTLCVDLKFPKRISIHTLGFLIEKSIGRD
jgi:hypothetical protein